MVKVFILLILSSVVHAEENANFDYVRPVIGENVIRRNQENLNTIDLNIRSLQSSLKNSDKNIQTLDAEVARLDQIVTDHAELKKRYENYLNSADAEIKKFQETHSNRDTASQKGKEGAEPAEESSWMQDAKTKTDRVKELLQRLEGNMAEAKANKTKNLETLEATKTKKIKLQRDLENALQKKNNLLTALRDSQTKRIMTSIRAPKSN